MSTSASILLQGLRTETSEGAITPDRLATIIEVSMNEAKSAADGAITVLPEYLEQDAIQAIATTAANALNSANNAYSRAEAVNTLTASAQSTANQALSKANSADSAAAAAQSTADSALQKAESALSAINNASGCTCEETTAAEFNSLISELFPA